MLRRFLVVFLVLFLFLFAYMPTTQESSLVNSENKQDYYSGIAGDWASPSHQLYLMNGITVTFSEDLQDEDKRMWLLYLEKSIDFLPVHMSKQLNGLLFSFNSGNTCIENNYYACFTPRNFSIFFSTTKRVNERENMRTILHEIGHAIDYKINPREASFSEDLHKNNSRPTFYASTNSLEDFAESFSIYILSPGYLSTCCKVRYEFMRDNIFLGKEYFNK